MSPSKMLLRCAHKLLHVSRELKGNGNYAIKASREWKDNGIHDLGCREWQRHRKYHFSYSLNSLKGAI